MNEKLLESISRIEERLIYIQKTQQNMDLRLTNLSDDFIDFIQRTENRLTRLETKVSNGSRPLDKKLLSVLLTFLTTYASLLIFILKVFL